MKKYLYKNYLNTSFWIFDLWVLVLTPLFLLIRYLYFSPDVELLIISAIQLLFLTAKIVFTYYKVEKIKQKVDIAKPYKPADSTIRFYYTTNISLSDHSTHLDIIRDNKVIQRIEKPISNNSNLLLVKSKWLVWLRFKNINIYYQLMIENSGNFQQILKIVVNDVYKIDADEVERLANDIANFLNIEIKKVLS